MFKYYLKLSWLSIKRTPMLTLLMILAIGLGIGVTMTVLTVNYLMGKDPIPSKSSELFHVQLYSYGKGNSHPSNVDGFPWQITYQDAMGIHESPVPTRKTRSLATGVTVIPSQPESPPFMESARAIDSDFFGMFKLEFLYGDVWEKSVDYNPKNVAVISESLNDRLFKGENSVGKLVNLDEIQYTVVGVVKNWQPIPRFYDLNNGSLNTSEELFLPFSLLPIHQLPSWGNNSGWKTESINNYQDKLASEIVWNQYWVELNTESQKQDYNNWLAGYIKIQQSLGRFDHENAAASLKDVNQWMEYNNVVSRDNSILVGLSFMFLAVCMINTLGMLLAKFLRRASEVGVRRALGASRLAIFSQHLIDVGLIGLLGGILGLILGQFGLLGVKQLYSSYEQLVHMDATLIVTAILIALGSSILAGLYPAWKICRTPASVYLKTQ